MKILAGSGRMQRRRLDKQFRGDRYQGKLRRFCWKVRTSQFILQLNVLSNNIKIYITKYERGDYEFYELIKNKIIDERLLFP